MTQDHIKKEALFNEVKGSLFEYLICRCLSEKAKDELDFLNSLDQNYHHVLSQQDQMVRQFYPEMLPFLHQVSRQSSEELITYLGEIPRHPRLRGKFVKTSVGDEIHEADVLLTSSKGLIPLSLKLNKKNAFVNTKSGGVKSFFNLYFDFIDQGIQEEFNKLVDQEFMRMSYELHAFHDIEFPGNYSSWVQSGKSELPGELSDDERKIIRSFYARLAFKMHEILYLSLCSFPDKFSSSLPSLMGFSSSSILQLICFHDFKSGEDAQVCIYSFEDVRKYLHQVKILPFNQTSSVEILIGDWMLQIRIKPMNKFTTTAIKVNCSIKFKPL